MSLSTYPLNTPLINTMTAACRKAGKRLMRDFGEVDQLQVSRKGTANFVTDADLRAEKTLHEELSKVKPDFGFLMEEGGEKPGKGEYRWVVDPLDGTTNFMRAVPYFAVSVAVEHITAQGVEIVSGVVYDPAHDEMFMAEKGKGAFVNQRRLRAANQRARDFYFVTGTARIKSDYTERTSELTRYAATLDCAIRRGGAAALDLAYVAAGRYDAAWFAKLHKWDMAAGILLVREAGGTLSCCVGEEDYYEEGCILAATAPAHAALAKYRADS